MNKVNMQKRKGDLLGKPWFSYDLEEDDNE